MNPHLNQVIWFFKCFRLSKKKTLEYVSQMTDIELVMEVNSSLTEVFFLLQKSECCLDNWYNLLLDCTLKLIEMFAQESIVNLE